MRILFDDFTHINNKKCILINLINNLMNNDNEAKKLTIFKREHQKRHNKEDFQESKRINSEYIVSKSSSSKTTPKDNNDKIRNSAIIPKNNNFNNELKTKGNIAANKNLKAASTFNKIKSIKEVPEEVDHLIPILEICKLSPFYLPTSNYYLYV